MTPPALLNLLPPGSAPDPDFEAVQVDLFEMVDGVLCVITRGPGDLLITSLGVTRPETGDVWPWGNIKRVKVRGGRAH